MIHRILLIICSVILMFFISSCALSKPEDVNKAQLEQVLEQIQIDFRQLDLDGIMSHYSPDYLHDGTGLSVERTTWQTRMNTYSSFDFTNLHYDINNDTAVVSGTAKWVISLQDEITTEPQENGDFSYFIKIDGTWRIYGNHHYSASPSSGGSSSVAPSSGGSSSVALTLGGSSSVALTLGGSSSVAPSSGGSSSVAPSSGGSSSVAPSSGGSSSVAPSSGGSSSVAPSSGGSSSVAPSSGGSSFKKE